jgi:hypothetical protein
MSSLITFDLTQKQYDTLMKFLDDNNGSHIIKLLKKSRDDDYTPPPQSERKIDRYDYCEGSAEEEELEVSLDSEGFSSLK